MLILAKQSQTMKSGFQSAYRTKTRRPGLNVLISLLRGSQALTIAAIFIRLVYHFKHLTLDATFGVLIGAMLYFFFLERLAYSRYSLIAPFLFSFSYLLIATFLAFTWGALLPESILLYALTVVTATILIGSFGGLLFTLLSTVILTFIVYGASQHFFHPDTSWTSSQAGYGDIIVYTVTFVLMLTTGWLSNNAIAQSLREQVAMQEQLQKERDGLDERLRQRTEELQQQQRSEIDRIYRFAYFGRVASGLLHDIAGPIATVSHTLQKIHQKESSDLMDRAIRSTKRIELFINSARNELNHHKTEGEVHIVQEIERALTEHQERITEKGIQILTTFEGPDLIHGDSVKLYRVMSNILLNALEAIDTTSSNPSIAITHSVKKHHHTIAIRDNGKGIPPEVLPSIFEPFYTSKAQSGGMGLGLSICQEIIKEFFAGNISIKSGVGSGTTVTITLTDKHQEHV